jgi:hypothetical protein
VSWSRENMDFPKLLTEMEISLNLQDDDVSPAPSGPKAAGTWENGEKTEEITHRFPAEGVMNLLIYAFSKV